ncbi:phasin family protein [Caballeronia terrestris]|uniref:Phasin family protein n=1 Tax=Caballeronia terrestris TaxID=1226301 RepID=A0A158KV76_9BURK|nr:phasin family protein [Caballeronia terrestris]SAL84510.1 phasin family protein [Caballeronia terrestris]
MSTMFPQQYLPAQSAQVQNLFGALQAAFDGIEKLTALNLQVVKTSLAENQVIVEKAFATRSPQEFFELSSSVAKATAEKANLYGKQVKEIVSNMQSEAATTAKSQIAEYQREGQDVLNKLTKKPAPASNVIVAP